MGIIYRMKPPGIETLLASGNGLTVGVPHDVVVDHSGTNIYVVEWASSTVIKKNLFTGTTTLIAGSSEEVGFTEGALATEVNLSYPTSIALAPNGDLYIVDAGVGSIRRINTKTGRIYTVVSPGTFDPYYATFNPQGTELYFTLRSGAIQKVVLSSGAVFTVAALDPGLTGIAFNNQGNLYVANENTSAVYLVNSNGSTTLVAGNNPSGGLSGDGGAATSASLFMPHDIIFDSNNNLYIADRENSRVRVVNAATGIINSVTDANGVALNSTALGLDIDSGGRLYITQLAPSGAVLRKY